MIAIIIASLVATTYAQIYNLTSPGTAASTEAQSSFGPSLAATLLLDGSAPTGYVASLVAANPCDTTYVLECADAGSPNQLCRTASDVTLTVTARPTDYELLYERDFPLGGSGTVTQSCNFEGPSPSFTQAVCSLSAWVALGGRRSQITSTVETVSSSDIPMTAMVPITAGAANTASTCNASTSPSTTPTGVNGNMPTARTMSMADAAPTGLTYEVYKVLVPVGAAAVGLGLV